MQRLSNDIDEIGQVLLQYKEQRLAAKQAAEAAAAERRRQMGSQHRRMAGAGRGKRHSMNRAQVRREAMSRVKADADAKLVEEFDQQEAGMLAGGDISRSRRFEKRAEHRSRSTSKRADLHGALLVTEAARAKSETPMQSKRKLPVLSLTAPASVFSVFKIRVAQEGLSVLVRAPWDEFSKVHCQAKFSVKAMEFVVAAEGRVCDAVRSSVFFPMFLNAMGHDCVAMPGVAGVLSQGGVLGARLLRAHAC